LFTVTAFSSIKQTECFDFLICTTNLIFRIYFLNNQGRQFYATEFWKYAGKFGQICGSNMQLNMHFMNNFLDIQTLHH